MHFWRNIAQTNWVRNFSARSMVNIEQLNWTKQFAAPSWDMDMKSIERASRETLGARVLALVAGMFVVDAGFEWIGLFDLAEAASEERDPHAISRRRKRCEVAKADLEMLERKILAMKEKLHARAQNDINKGKAA